MDRPDDVSITCHCLECEGAQAKTSARRLQHLDSLEVLMRERIIHELVSRAQAAA